MDFNADEFLWTQKYRPQKIADVILPKSIKELFEGYVREGQMQSMLLTSASPGTGKTTVALALCAEMGIRPLFINASMDNSIEDIRVKVVNYATTVSLVSNSTKVVVLDEAERLTPAAQDSLKGLMEQVSKNCRFILTANAKSRIIEPLRSRCTEVEFAYSKEDSKASAAMMYKRACEILDQEGIVYSKAVVAKVVTKYVPDNRSVLAALQKYAIANKVIDEGILGQLAAADTSVLIDALKAKKFMEVKQWCFDNQDKLTDDFYGKLFTTLESRLQVASVPEAVLIIDEWQSKHSVVPDRYIHFLAMMTNLMMQVQFV